MGDGGRGDDGGGGVRVALVGHGIIGVRRRRRGVRVRVGVGGVVRVGVVMRERMGGGSGWRRWRWQREGVARRGS